MANVDAEASYFSKLLHIPEERLNNLQRDHFGMHVRGEGSSIVHVPLARLPFRTMTEVERVAHEQRMIDVYGYQVPKMPEPPKKEGSGSVPASRETEAPKASTQQKGQPEVDPHTGDHTKPASKWGS